MSIEDSELESPPSLEEFNEACISDVSDEEILSLLERVHSGSLEEQQEILRILLKHRPEVQKERTKRILGK